MPASDGRGDLRALHRARALLDLCDTMLALDATRREALLARLDESDHELRDELRALLEAVNRSGNFLELGWRGTRNGRRR